MLYVRAVTDADTDQLAQLFVDARVKAFHWCPPHAFETADFVRETEGEVVFVACDDDSVPLGFISVWEPDHFIHHLFVAPTAQRQGIGTLLLTSLESWLPRPYRLKCLLANKSALAFYESLGWKEISRGGDAGGEYALLELS